MKLLVVGGGGREHALVKKLKENSAITEIFVAPGNGGIGVDATIVAIKATEVSTMVRFAVENNIDFVVVAPDDPLVLGMVDALEEVGIPAFGPSKKAAQIEGSKVFSKNLMKKHGIPTAEYSVFDESEKALAYIKEKNQFPVVIKADGLALGKGVVIVETLAQGEECLKAMMEDKIFGESGSRVVVEEFITGPEVSVLAFADGETIVPMVSAMDHKSIFEGGKGPNTGGMGTVAPNPHYTQEVAAICMETIFVPTLKAMKSEGAPFKGCLFFGLMLTPNGPKVIEYNCRFGDPETQVVLPLLATDLLTIMQATVAGTLDKGPIEWKQGACACVVVASGGYPGEYLSGKEITGLNEEGQAEDVTVYHAGTKKTEAGFVTAGGRVLGVTAYGETLPQALEKAYHGVEKISFEGIQYRKDIGTV